MKYLLIPLAFATSAAMACPADGSSKDAAASVERQPMASVAAAPSKATVVKAASTKSVTKVAAKAAEQRKVTRL